MPRPVCQNSKVYVSLAILAWNEELTISSALASVYDQTLFSDLAKRGLGAEVVVVLNGCTDNTAARATQFFSERAELNPAEENVHGRVAILREQGKLNAWNSYVHEHSAPEARFMIFMDADILLLNAHTLSRMVAELEQASEAHVAVDLPRKSIEFKQELSFAERLSLGASTVTRSASAQLCAQLYCIRTEVARQIYLPRDLTACEDGFLKLLVCTSNLTEPSKPARIRLAPGAEHAFDAYTSLKTLVRNQKRQVMGQTMIHLLVDKFLPKEKANGPALAPTLRNLDASDPDWLKRELSIHLGSTRSFWQVCPGYVSTPIRRWRRLRGSSKLTRFPAAFVQFSLALVGSFLAYKAMKNGCTAYWPKAERRPAPLAPLSAPSPT